MSEDPSIDRFVPHVPSTNPTAPPAVWAIDTRHLPMFWFPRQCPRGCVWMSDRTTVEDRECFFGHSDALRIHVMESSWWDRMRVTTLHAYRLPAEPFAPHEEVGGYWTATGPVDPLECVVLDDLVGLHAGAGIELRVTPSIWPWWSEVAGSTLEFSGSRLRNASDHPDRTVD